MLVAVIGKAWVTLCDPAGNRRITNVGDFVALEVATALERGIRVIPVLVGGASMPRLDELPPRLAKLVDCNAVAIDDNRFAQDFDNLVDGIIAGRAASRGGSSTVFRAASRGGSSTVFSAACASSRRVRCSRPRLRSSCCSPPGCRRSPDSAKTKVDTTKVVKQPPFDAAKSKETTQMMKKPPPDPPIKLNRLPLTPTASAHRARWS